MEKLQEILSTLNHSRNEYECWWRGYCSGRCTEKEFYEGMILIENQFKKIGPLNVHHDLHHHHHSTNHPSPNRNHRVHSKEGLIKLS